ncbi:hypothetical protein EVAR_18612_1 [Eumeta japonica]|uniref:Uncharacterized protein n=1 Tax=Eumeta variegata TaxID=151549 RepID=A0A4C1V2X5_EUMVA|nr:hypothetical protein EVAR_18612_1 [Eumeta japonica]
MGFASRARKRKTGQSMKNIPLNVGNFTCKTHKDVGISEPPLDRRPRARAPGALMEETEVYVTPDSIEPFLLFRSEGPQRRHRCGDDAARESIRFLELKTHRRIRPSRLASGGRRRFRTTRTGQPPPPPRRSVSSVAHLVTASVTTVA